MRKHLQDEGDKIAKDIGDLTTTEKAMFDKIDDAYADRAAPTAPGVDTSAVKAADPTFDEAAFIVIVRETFELVRRARTLEHEQFDDGLLSPQLAQEVKQAIAGDVASHQHHLLPGLEIRSAVITSAQVVDGKLNVVARLHLWAGSTAPAASVEKGSEWDEDWTFWRDPTIDASATDRDHATRREAEGAWMFAHNGWIVTAIQRDGADAAAG